MHRVSVLWYSMYVAIFFWWAIINTFFSKQNPKLTDPCLPTNASHKRFPSTSGSFSLSSFNTHNHRQIAVLQTHSSLSLSLSPVPFATSVARHIELLPQTTAAFQAAYQQISLIYMIEGVPLSW